MRRQIRGGPAADRLRQALRAGDAMRELHMDLLLTAPADVPDNGGCIWCGTKDNLVDDPGVGKACPDESWDACNARHQALVNPSCYQMPPVILAGLDAAESAYAVLAEVEAALEEHLTVKLSEAADRGRTQVLRAQVAKGIRVTHPMLSQVHTRGHLFGQHGVIHRAGDPQHRKFTQGGRQEG